MSTVKLKLALVILLAGSIIFSCKKDKSSGEECKISTTSLSGTYKLSSLKYKVNKSVAEQDFLASMDDCEKDDLIILNSNGTYDHLDVGTTCLPLNNDNGSWAVNGHTLTSDGDFNGTITSFDCKTIVYYIENIFTPGDRLVFTMVKQ